MYSFEDAKFHDVSLFMMIMKQLYFMMRSFMGLPKNTIVYHDWSPTTIYWAPLLDKPTWQVIDSERCAEPLAELNSFCRENRHFHTDLPKRRKRFSQIWEPKKHPQMTQMQSLSTLFHGSSAHSHGCRCFLHYLKNDR